MPTNKWLTMATLVSEPANGRDRSRHGPGDAATEKVATLAGGGSTTEPHDTARLLREISELRDALRQAEYAARHDYLTGLLNRRAFDEKAEELLLKRQASGEGAGLLWIDLDGFERINDREGHKVGDAALKWAAHALLKVCRSDAVVGRVGGDEFCVLQPNLSRPSEAERLGRLIQRELSNPGEAAGIHVSASIGIAIAGHETCDLAELKDRADDALYRAKSEGGGAIRLYSDPGLARGSDDPSALSASDLRKAIAADELRLFYQPKFGARTQQAESLEALVRWQHPSRGLLSPGTFLPLAEQGDLMRSLTEWTLRQAAADRRALLAGGRDLPIYVNISGRLLAEPGFATNLLTATGGLIEGIGLEITETEIIDDREAALRNLGQCVELGFKIAIDDYGTGLSSLSYLKQLPAHELKIDRSFISDLTRSHRDPLLVRSTIDLAHALGLSVTAEGVEAPAALALLAVMGCDSVQGFLLAKPMPFATTLSFLDDHEAQLASGDGTTGLGPADAPAHHRAG